jgi:CRISPR/Cas system type I-B associated protein Csh2 (Cas7 group RAMP superfamily)
MLRFVEFVYRIYTRIVSFGERLAPRFRCQHSRKVKTVKQTDRGDFLTLTQCEHCGDIRTFIIKGTTK